MVYDQTPDSGLILEKLYQISPSYQMRSHLGSMVLQSLYPFPWRYIAFHIFLYPISSFSLFQWASIYLYSDIHSLCSFSHQFFLILFLSPFTLALPFFLFLFLSQLPCISILMSTIPSLYALSGINFFCHLVLYLSLHISIPTSFFLFSLSPINFSHLISLSIPTLPSIFFSFYFYDCIIFSGQIGGFFSLFP